MARDIFPTIDLNDGDQFVDSTGLIYTASGNGLYATTEGSTASVEIKVLEDVYGPLEKIAAPDPAAAQARVDKARAASAEATANVKAAREELHAAETARDEAFARWCAAEAERRNQRSSYRELAEAIGMDASKREAVRQAVKRGRAAAAARYANAMKDA